MKTTLLILAAALAFDCGGSGSNSTKPSGNSANAPAANTAQAPPAKTTATPELSPTVFIPKDGDYTGQGTIIKIYGDAGTVDIEHGDIPGLMPAMRMIFNVQDKSIFKDVRDGDKVEFVIEYKHPSEIVKSFKKLQ